MALSVSVEKLETYLGHLSGIYALIAGNKQSSFISGAGDGLVAEWDVQTTKDAVGIAKIETQIFSLCLLKDLQVIVIGDMKGGIHFIQLSQKNEIKYYQINQESIFDIKFNRKTNSIWCLSGKGEIYIFSVPEFSFLSTKKISDSSLRTIQFHPQKPLAFCGASDGNIYVLNEYGEVLKKINQAHKNSIFSLCINSNQTYLFSGSRDAQLGIWDLKNEYSEVKMLPAHLFTINDIQMSPSGNLIATAGRDKHIKLWDATNFELLKVIDLEKYQGHRHSVNKLFWRTSNNILISCSDDKQIISWKITEQTNL